MSRQNTAIPKKESINCNGKLIDLSIPRVMGILNVTPDSFYDGGSNDQIDQLIAKAEKHLIDGAAFLDVGGVSTRPGADDVNESDELKRVIPAIEAIHQRFPEAIISIDTFRSEVAKKAIAAGASMINDISGGNFDPLMFQTVAELQVPYILMHIQGKPTNMQAAPTYQNIVDEVLQHLLDRTAKLRALGVHDILIDPGFGFGKSLEHNYKLLDGLQTLGLMGLPILVGVSRKRMINQVLETRPEDALNGTTVANTLALERGTSILRVHDVKEAVECVKIQQQLHQSSGHA